MRRNWKFFKRQRILNIDWPMEISNEDQYHRSCMSPFSEEIKIRRWGWIGHTVRAQKQHKNRTNLGPEGKRKRGRSTLSWRRTVEAKIKQLGWNYLKMAENAEIGQNDKSY